MLFWDQMGAVLERSEGRDWMRIGAPRLLVSALFAINLLAAGGCPAVVLAAGPLKSVADELNLIEHRYFFRLYTRDPIEKRLERIELLVFGSTQSGSNDERAARLKKAMAERDASSSTHFERESAGERPQSPVKEKLGSDKKTASEGAGPGSSSSQYPILNTLEWRALKKTFATDSLDQRLERLEARIFGSSSPAMAYADRVERLKRTLGVGVAQSIPPGPTGPLGPMPKARPRSRDYFDGMPPQDLFEQFGGSSMLPFGAMPGMSEIFNEFRSQMEQMQRMPNGVWEWDSGSGTWTERNNGQRLRPGQGQSPLDINPSRPSPLSPSLPLIPKRHRVQPSPVIPPYDDPNSI
jgi:hypothetical protein